MTDDRRVKLADPFLLNCQPSELKIASEFLTTWLPFLSRDLCHHCTTNLSNRIGSLNSEFERDSKPARVVENVELREEAKNNHGYEFGANSVESSKDGEDTNLVGGWKDAADVSSAFTPEASTRKLVGESPAIETFPRMSWADMAEEDELEGGEEEEERESSKRVVNGSDSNGVSKTVEKLKLSREQREYIRFMNVKRKNDYICFERVKGKFVNILAGLELHTGIFSAVEQKRIVDQVYMLLEKGRMGELRERTYTAPEKWMRGKGRVTIQFGCCYNYAVDKNGNPPGILRNETVDPIPHLFKVIIRRLVRWHVLPPTCIPDSCIVNIYDEGDCIPPHIDNHDFVRPFCTVSFLSECSIFFGSNLKVVGPGEFAGSIAIPLPVGSVLVLNGNGADVAKHCVPAVPAKRISITFRRMDESKRPIGYSTEPDLLRIQPLSYDMSETDGFSTPGTESHTKRRSFQRSGNRVGSGFSGREPHTKPGPPWSRQGPGSRRRGSERLDST